MNGFCLVKCHQIVLLLQITRLSSYIFKSPKKDFNFLGWGWQNKSTEGEKSKSIGKQNSTLFTALTSN